MPPYLLYGGGMVLQESQLNINSTETTLLYHIREELRENNRLLRLLTNENNQGDDLTPVEHTTPQKRKYERRKTNEQM